MKLPSNVRAIAVVLWALLSPAMACMRPDAQMTATERACCRMMQDQCGDMGMPASHGCCHTTLQGADQIALNAKAAALPPLAATTVALAALDLSAPTSAPLAWVVSAEHSPPKPPLPSVSVLRV